MAAGADAFTALLDALTRFSDRKILAVACGLMRADHVCAPPFTGGRRNVAGAARQPSAREASSPSTRTRKHMSLLANDPLTQLAFSIFENKGVYAVLLGSRLSRAAEIPTGWEITLNLIRRIAGAKGISDQTDWAKWYKGETGNDPDYSALLEELAATPEERRAVLQGYIEPVEEDRQEGRKIPTAAHRAIAALVRSGYIRVLITTNFDRLLEESLFPIP
jgi:hypothetical protein